jgi:uncharacterized damage-inducible protein DinB
MTNEERFLEYSAEKLTQHTTRISACLDKLSAEQVWRRGSDSENAVGNLVLHLTGNVRQWIGAGVGALPDIRVRDREFAARGDIQPAELKTRIEAAVAESCGIIRGLTAERLSETITVQAYNVTVLEAVYHVVEHFAGHAGQILFATKLFTSGDLGFYKHLTAKTHQETVP